MVIAGAAPHTVRVFDDDLENLRAMVCEMGGWTEAAIADSLAALVSDDEERAERAIACHPRIAIMNEGVEKRAICVIALRAPMADDLREIILAIKISELVARMAEDARDIATRVPLVRACRGIDEIKLLAAIGAAVTEMVRASLDAFAKGGVRDKARLCQGAQAIRDHYAIVAAKLIDRMRGDPREIAAAAHLLLLAQTLKRIGEAAGKIARSLDSGTDDALPQPAVA